MQKGESVFFLLLSLCVLVAQCALGMGEWYVLLTQWALAGVIAALLMFCINNNRLYTLSSKGLTAMMWTNMASMWNLCYLHLNSTLLWWQTDLLIFGFTLLIILSIGAWLSGDSPIRYVTIGLIIGLCTLVLPQALWWIPLFVWLLFYMRNFSLRNVCAVLSGAILMVWLCYCCLVWLGNGAEGKGMTIDEAYLLSFAGLLNWSLPHDVIRSSEMVFTPMLFMLFAGGAFLVCLFSSLVSNVMNSLRIHASVIASVMTGLAIPLFMFIYPQGFVFYLGLSAVVISLNLALVLANVSNASLIRWWVVILLTAEILLGVGETIINYLLTL